MLNNIEVSKQKLITTLEENLEIHKELYSAAVESYREKYKKALEDHCKKIRKNEWEHPLSLPTKPQSYAKEYENVLKQLEFSVSDTITLNQNEFNQFVLDEWAFDRLFYRELNISNGLSESALMKISTKRLSV